MIDYNMSMEDYLAHPAYNASKLKLMLKTSLDFKEGLDDANSETKSTILGTALHTLLLEPKEFNQRYALQSEDFGKKNAGEGKKKWDAFKKANNDKIVLGKTESDFLLKFKARKNPAFRLLVASGDAEVTGILEDEIIPRKARADLLNDDTIYDVKSSIDGMDDTSIYRTIKRYKYDFSAAHYMTVFNKLFPNRFKKYCWVFADTDSPAQHLRIIRCPEIMLKRALYEYESVINKLEYCIAKDTWEGYPKHETELELPHWAEELK